MFHKSLRPLTLFFGLMLSLSPVLVNASGKLPVVEITPVATKNWQDQLQALGTVSARNQIVITSRVDGVIKQLNFMDGQTVSAGQNLIKMDDSLERARLQEMEIQLKEDIRRLGELEKLIARQAVSQSELEAHKSVVARSQAQLEAARITLSFYSLEAAFNGALGLHDLSPGQYIKPGDPLVSLTDLNNLFIDFMLPSKYISQIDNGMDIELSFDAWPERMFSAEIAMIDPVINTESRNLKIRASVQNDDQLLRPGLLASITLNLPSEEVMSIETSSIFYRGSQAFVYRVNMNGQAFEQPVDTSTISGATTLITDGLEVGDNIITLGIGKVRNGMTVDPAQVTADKNIQATGKALL